MISIMPQPRRFVLLEHRWNGIHWDLMLEADGFLKTWRLAEPLRPGEQPAEASFDHRLHYLHYEGPISGSRGEVKRLDCGTYVGALSSESFEIELNGESLRGRLRISKEGESCTAAWHPA